MNNNETISIIPARGGSKGIPQKNIISVGGKPLLAWTIQQSLCTDSIDKTFVSTNNNEIAKVSKRYGAEVIWRPDELCTDDASAESAILHALDFLDNKRIIPKYIVFLQATSPLRKKDDINNAIRQFKHENADSLISGSKFDDFLFWEKQDGNWKSVNFDYKARGIRQGRKPQFVENGAIYIFKPEILKKYGNRIGGNLELYEMEFWQTWEIDTKEDIELIEFYLNLKIKPR